MESAKLRIEQPFTIVAWAFYAMRIRLAVTDFRHTDSDRIAPVSGLTDVDRISFEAKEQPPAPAFARGRFCRQDLQ